MADETRFCTGCGAPNNPDEEYCPHCRRKSVYLTLDTEFVLPTEVEAVPAEIPTEAQEVTTDYTISAGPVPSSLPVPNYFEWLETVLHSPALRPGGWGWYAGFSAIGGILAFVVVNRTSRPPQSPSASSAVGQAAPSLLEAPRVTAPSVVAAPALTPPSVTVVPRTPLPNNSLGSARFYRVENGHYAALTVEEEREAAREAVAWEQQRQLSTAARRTDSLVQAAQR